MSILESIQKVEAKAEELKLVAREKVKQLLEEAKKDGENEGKMIIAEAEAQAKKIIIDTTKQIKAMEDKILNEYQLKDQQLAKRVSTKFDDVIDFIIGKVMTI